jgi:hypothetical protein
MGTIFPNPFYLNEQFMESILNQRWELTYPNTNITWDVISAAENLNLRWELTYPNANNNIILQTINNNPGIFDILLPNQNNQNNQHIALGYVNRFNHRSNNRLQHNP